MCWLELEPLLTCIVIIGSGIVKNNTVCSCMYYHPDQ